MLLVDTILYLSKIGVTLDADVILPVESTVNAAI